MSKTVFKLMAFSIMLNFAIGIMMTAIVDANGNQIFTPESGRMGGTSYNESYQNTFTGQMEKGIDPSGVLEDQGNAIYRVLDMMNIGFIARVLEVIKQYAFGFIKLLDNILGGYLEPTVRTLLFGYPFGILYVLMTIGYIVGAWTLWTDKDLGN